MSVPRFKKNYRKRLQADIALMKDKYEQLMTSDESHAIRQGRMFRHCEKSLRRIKEWEEAQS